MYATLGYDQRLCLPATCPCSHLEVSGNSTCNLSYLIVLSFFSLFACVCVCYRLKINEPLLFLISGRDELVPPAQMRMLYSKASRNSEGSAKVVEYPEGGHMDLWVKAGERYWRTVQLFVQDCTSRAS